MKKIDEVYELLGIDESSYFCGSSCFCSLLPLCQYYKEQNAELSEELETIYKYASKLVEEDNALFALTKKSELTDDDWKNIGDIFEDYIHVISSLSDVIPAIADVDLKKLFKDDLIFISRLFLDNSSHFFDREDLPEDIRTLMNIALAEIRRDYENE